MSTYPHCSECGCDLLEMSEREAEMCAECETGNVLDSIPDSDETKERLDLLNKGLKGVGFSLTCPRCTKKSTFFSASDEAWVCLECGVVFSSMLSYIMGDILDNDKLEIS